MPQSVFGSAKFRSSMTPADQGMAQDVASVFADAIRVAEGNKNYGVLYEKGDPRTITQNSVVNNIARWRAAGSPGKFVDFMQKRWAPVGAKNDPKNLNKNWSGNVRGALKKQQGDAAYQTFKDWNLVKTPMDSFNSGVA